MRGLHGKVVIVTGAGHGIGEAFARRLAADGCKVVIADINPFSSQSVVVGIRREDGEAISIVTDVSDEDSVQAMAQAVVSAYGRIDGLVNNAGMFASGMSPVSGITVDRWDRLMAVNVRGSFLCARAVHPMLTDGGGGRIVNVGSTMAMIRT